MDERTINSIFLTESPAFLQFLDNDYASFASDSVNDFIVSTYQLSKDNENVRTGSVLLISSKDALVQHRIETNGGVFRFEILPNTTIIIASLTSGRLTSIDVAKEKQNTSCILSGGIILDVSWNKLTSKILCSDDYGELMVADATCLRAENRWMAHKSAYGLAVCEVWSCAWLANSPNVCASGAEDGNLKLWDTRGTCTKPQSMNSKSHDAGVVFVGAIAVGNENELVTGSYDENIRIFDVRKIDEPMSKHKLSGGVWHVERMSVHDRDEELYLASCMYGGWCIVSKSSASRFEIVHVGRDRFGDENLLYGISSRRLADGQYSVASCTFNDKCVRICEVSTNRNHQ